MQPVKALKKNFKCSKHGLSFFAFKGSKLTWSAAALFGFSSQKAIATTQTKGPTCFQRSRQEADSCSLLAMLWAKKRLSVQLAYIYKIDNLQYFFFFKCMVLFKLFYYSIYYAFILQCGQVNRAIKPLTLFHLVLEFKCFRILLA